MNGHKDDGKGDLLTERPSEISTEKPLSRLSCHTKHAVTLNQIDRIEINSTYETPEGMTIYVMDVYLKYVQKGLPRVQSSQTNSRLSDDTVEAAASEVTFHEPDLAPTQIRAKKTKKEEETQLRKDSTKARPKPEYTIEYRYSDFRTLRNRIRCALSEESTSAQHVKWCFYCNRVEWVVYFVSFPSRCSLREALARSIGYNRKYGNESRCKKLAAFINRLVHAAKDNSYWYDVDPCEGFVNVSFLLHDFLAEPHLRASYTGW